MRTFVEVKHTEEHEYYTRRPEYLRVASPESSARAKERADAVMQAMDYAACAHEIVDTDGRDAAAVAQRLRAAVASWEMAHAR